MKEKGTEQDLAEKDDEDLKVPPRRPHPHPKKAFEVGTFSIFKSQLRRPVWLKQSSIQLTRRCITDHTAHLVNHNTILT